MNSWHSSESHQFYWFRIKMFHFVVHRLSSPKLRGRRRHLSSSKYQRLHRFVQQLFSAHWMPTVKIGKSLWKKKTETRWILCAARIRIGTNACSSVYPTPGHVSKSTRCGPIGLQVEAVFDVPQWRHRVFQFGGRTSPARCRNLAHSAIRACFDKTAIIRNFYQYFDVLPPLRQFWTARSRIWRRQIAEESFASS